MYDKARRGESIELSPRQISIFQFDIERSLEDRFFFFVFPLPLKLLDVIHLSTRTFAHILHPFYHYGFCLVSLYKVYATHTKM